MLKKKTLIYLSVAASLALLVPRTALGESVSDFLHAFHKEPARMMERLPSVVDASGQAHPQGFIDHQAMAAIFEARSEARALITGNSLNADTPLSGTAESDAPEKILDPGARVERNIGAMQTAGWMKLEASTKPWADSYWPTYKGQLGNRYSDPGFPGVKDWQQNFAYVEASPASLITSEGALNRINSLSPSEKYDFVMGDFDWTLTRFSWAQGKKRMDDDGGVATWMGICHGWAGAAHMGVPFVSQPVIVVAQNGTPVTFYPQDIKALQSMLWANASPNARFVGSRCTVSRPARNSNGRVVDPSCFDTSPATWHLAVVNQLGGNHRSFVFDGTYDVQVWNFPLHSTRYSYFNPQTFEETSSLSQAMIRSENFRVDKFKEFRSPNARHIVGIYMDVTHVIEIEPGVSRVFDAPTKTVRYIYDLELDESRNVVGGEWYSNAHPDFIWTYEPNAQAMAREENLLLTDPWRNRGPLPLHWTAFARSSSARGAPLFAFLKDVIESGGSVTQP